MKSCKAGFLSIINAPNGSFLRKGTKRKPFDIFEL